MSDDREPIGFVVDLYVLGEDGAPRLAASVAEWGESQRAHRRVALTELDDGTAVSTVFLGIDPSGIDPPLLFETAVRRDEHWAPVARYPTRAQALAGHAVWVAQRGREEGAP